MEDNVERLTDDELNGLFSFYWSDYSNWFDVDREMAGKVLSVIDELRTLRAENAELRATHPVQVAKTTRQWFNEAFHSPEDWG
jgi:hypothetical protein